MSNLQPGQAFGPYRLVGLISRGGMGQLWRAVKEGEGAWKKEVALKLMLPGVAVDDRFVAQFHSEARIAAILDHPNIVGVFAFGREDGILWIEQELVDGADLGHMLARAKGQQIPGPLAVYVAAEILKALQYALERTGPDGKALGIIHRDVKPGNVLCAREGYVKLADFGIAKVTSSSARTLIGARGTAGYIAPEQVRGQPASPSSDVFAVGLVLWEMLTGKPLFSGETEAERLLKTADCEVPALTSIRKDAPPSLDAALHAMLGKTPNERFAHAGAALEALLSSAGRVGSSVDLKRFLATLPGAQPATRAAA